jgi:DNA polymerase III epsilon subunit family exonuclease
VDRPIAFVDTETATLLGAPHLLEIGAVRVVDGEAVDRFESLVRPQVPIEAEATAIHGIENEAIRDAPDAGEVLARFLAWLGEDWMAAHGARFDAGVLAFESVRWGLPLSSAPMLDTVKIARKLLPDSPDHKLPTLCQVLDIDTLVHHRALPDAVSCWKVLEACVERLPEEVTTTSQDLFAISQPLVTVALAAPKQPRIVPRLRPIEAAVRSGTKVTFLYGETDQVSRLSVLPRILFESRRRGYMEAECLRSGLLKTYRLDRVHRILESA